MKFTSKIIGAAVIVIIGLLLIGVGAFMKVNEYSDGWIAGNNFIVLGMLTELLGVYIIFSELLKNAKK